MNSKIKEALAIHFTNKKNKKKKSKRNKRKTIDENDSIVSAFDDVMQRRISGNITPTTLSTPLSATTTVKPPATTPLTARNS